MTAGGGADSLVVKANVSSGYFDISGGTSDTLIFQSVSAVGTTIKGGLDADLVSLYGANDLVLNNFSGDTLMAGTGADTLLFTVSATNTSIAAGSGADLITMAGSSAQGGNTINLGVGADTVVFTETTSNDTVTVSSVSISSSNAKYVTYQGTATGAAITTAAGADVVGVQDLATDLSAINTPSGNIRFTSRLVMSLASGYGCRSDRSMPPMCWLDGKH